MFEMSTQLYRAEDLLGMEDEYELDEGVLVPMSRGTMMHGQVCVNATVLVKLFVREHRLGHVFGNDTGFVLHRNPDTLRGPDVAFVRAERMSEVPKRGWYEGSPDLAIEVRSPDDRPGQVHNKVGQYLEAGCQTVWLVDPERRNVVKFCANGDVQVLNETDTLSGDTVLPGFSTLVSAFFE